MRGERGAGIVDAPSDEMEAPDNLNSSDPIWMGNTRSWGSRSGILDTAFSSCGGAGLFEGRCGFPLLMLATDMSAAAAAAGGGGGGGGWRLELVFEMRRRHHRLLLLLLLLGFVVEAAEEEVEAAAAAVVVVLNAKAKTNANRKANATIQKQSWQGACSLCCTVLSSHEANTSASDMA